MNKLTDKELIDELRARMAEKTNALQELKLLNMKLEESEKLKSHFISNITNEIVNPFSSILGLSKSILSVDKENWKKVNSMVAMIHSEAFSLDFQLKNIFAAAKIEAGEIYPEIGRVNIDNLVRSVSDSFRLEAMKKKLKIELIFGVEEERIKNFRTDPEKLKLILSNLINNAVKFSYEESTIAVNIRMAEPNLIISVLNKGVEISEGYKQFIFDRFKRADSDITSVNRGHGLGLSIIRALLDLLEGEISFNSDNVNGTKFIISIPESNEQDDSFTTSLNGDEMFFEDNQVF
ncbi:MAG TPA: HAMP domain-containing sensor histidine kinase [Bacteroidales bacterium]|nr:HAMP domain-containing sensor histidine kinase [Bacteroidales bacterium]